MGNVTGGFRIWDFRFRIWCFYAIDKSECLKELNSNEIIPTFRNSALSNSEIEHSKSEIKASFSAAPGI
jgi:hypothetical protein